MYFFSTFNPLLSQSSTFFDFNTPGQLNDFFNATGPGINNVTQESTGGINNSGSVAVPQISTNAIFATKDGYSLGPAGSSYQFESYIKSVFNAGYSGLGFTPSSPADGSTVTAYRPDNSMGISVHGGGFLFHNGNTNYNGNWQSGGSGITTVKATSINDLLNNGSPDNWYKIVFQITRSTETEYDLRVEVWPSLENGTLINPSEAEAIFEVHGLSNSNITNSPIIHSYFSFSGQRVSHFDNFGIELEGSTVVGAGMPSVLSISSSLSGNIVTIEGNVTSNDIGPGTDAGFVYSTSPNPTTDDNIVILSNGPGAFSGDTPPLSPGTYYFRTFANNSFGTSYGIELVETVPFTCDDFLAEIPPLDNGVYQISSFNHLRWISENPASWGAQFQQTDDIDASITSETCYNGGDGWSPIGNSSTRFEGTYDGGNFEISNLYINRTSTTRVGLFGNTRNNAEIRNLNLDNFDITGNYDVGGLVGYPDATTIENAHISNSSIKSPTNHNYSAVGGLVGNQRGGVDVIDCSATDVDVSGNSLLVGGLVGYMSSGSPSIKNSFATGGNVVSTGQRVAMGGLLGGTSSNTSTPPTVENCYAIIDLETTNYDNDNGGWDGIGGLVGDNGAIITNSYTINTFTTNKTTNRGGLVGKIDGSGGNGSNSFWDETVSSITTSVFGSGRTTTQMQQQATFINWDFQCETANGTDDIWGIDEGNDYPRLSWEGITQTCPTITWTGATLNTNWNNPSNWNPAGVPAESAEIIIPEGLVYYPQVTNLTFSGEITLERGASLTVTGELTNNGELTIEHGASLVQTEGSTLAGSGLYHQQIVVNGTGAASGNRQILFGPAIPNATTETINAAGSNRFWFFNETAHQWQEVTDNSTNFNGRAVLGRTDGVETYTFTSNQINNGDIEMAGLTRTGTTNNNRGYHNIANPYPSYINWHDVEREHMSRTYMIRTFNAGTNQPVRDFYSANSQVGTNNSDQPLGAEISRYIAPGQGFEVRVLGNGNIGKLEFSNEIRSHRNPSAQVTLSNISLARIRLFEESNAFDETVIFVNEEASNDLDDRDTEKSIFNNPSQFYSLESGKRLVMNGLNNPEEKGFVPLGFRATATGNYQIGLGNVSMQEPLILRDKESNTFHDLREGNYAFYSAEGENNERFELHFASLLNVKDNVSTDKAITIFAHDGQININIDDNINMENASIAVYDAQGALVANSSTKEHSYQLSSNLPKGMYVVKVQTNNGYFETRRVVL